MTPEYWTTLAIVGALIFGGTVGKVWRPVRKTVAAIDVVAGRAARYPGDPEERPGLAERLDTIDRSIADLRTGLEEVRKDVQNIEGCPE